MATQTKLVTAEELIKLPSDFFCELVDGVVIELSPPGGPHARIAAKVTLALGRAEQLGLGVVLGEMGFVLRRNPDTLRAPDLAFLRTQRIPQEGISSGYGDGSPDIVVEVVSPWNTAGEIQAKVRDWIEGGAGLVLVIFPDRRTVNVIRSLTLRETLTVDDVLDFGDALPGFSCPVADFFD